MSNNELHRNSTNYISTNDKFIPYLLSSLITTLVVIFVFKSGQSDGTDLLVASKPVTRSQMIFGKFAVALLIITAVQFLVFLSTISYIQFDHYSFEKEKVKYALAISSGGLIIQFIFSSFVVFVSLFVSKIGILTISIITSATIPIISMIIMPISKATPWGNSRWRGSLTRSYFVDNMEKTKILSKLNDIYSDPLTETILKNGDKDEIKKLNEKLKINRQPNIRLIEMVPRLKKESFIKSAHKYLSEKWYKDAAPFDIWYQWSSFTDSIINTSGGVYDYYLKKKIIKLPTKFSMNPGGNDIFSKIFLFSDLSTKNSYWTSIKKIDNDFKKAIDNIRTVSFEGKQKNIMELFSDESVPFTSRIDVIRQLNKNKREHIGISYRTYLVYSKVKKYFSTRNEKGEKVTNSNDAVYKKPKSIFGNEYDLFKRIHGNDVDATNEPDWLFVNNDEISVWTKKEYIPIGTRIWIWLAFVCIALTTTVFIYYRKDFK